MLAKVNHSSLPTKRTVRSLLNDPFEMFDDVLSTWSIFDRVPLGLETSYRYEVDEKELRIEVDVPGVKSEDVQLLAEASSVRLVAKRKNKNLERSFIVPEGYNVEAAEAKLEHGVLTLVMPALPRAAPKRIEIKVG